MKPGTSREHLALPQQDMVRQASWWRGGASLSKNPNRGGEAVGTEGRVKPEVRSRTCPSTLLKSLRTQTSETEEEWNWAVP